MLKLVDLFWTFQGEGFYAGSRALFVRMPFCNLKCIWCDTSFNHFENWSEEQFIEFATLEPCRFAVITGGEPMMNKQTPKIIQILKSLGFTIACETNGTFPIVPGIDFVTVSPKRDADYKIDPTVMEKASEFKYVVDNGFDFDILTKHKNSTARLSLSPEFGNFYPALEKIYSFIKENPSWKISLQTHKWMKIP